MANPATHHLCGSVYAPLNSPDRCPHLLYVQDEGTAYNIGGKRERKLQRYYVYCTAEGKCRSMGCVSSWTGNSPTWCPRRARGKEDKE